MDVIGKLDKAIDQHWERNDSAGTANGMKEVLKGKDKNWNRSCGEYLGFDDRVDLMYQINKLVACHSNAVIDFNRQLGPFVGAYEIATYEEDIRKGKKTRVVKPDLVTMQIPWYMVTTLLPKIYSKYHKNPYHKLDNEDDGSPFRDMIESRDQDLYTSPSNNSEYKWVEGWEFGIEPFGHKNLRAFLKARLEKKRKYIKAVVEARGKERRRIEKEKAEALELQAKEEKEEMRRLKYSNAYENLDQKEGECYAICEIKRVFTTPRNKANCLYLGETENFTARKKVYKDFSNPKNEIVNKLTKKFPKLTREKIISRLKNNLKVKRLKFKSLRHEGYRRHIEGYLIQRIRPLLNTAKSKGTYYDDRSFVVWNDQLRKGMCGIRTAHGSPATNNLFK
jgi:hypothetical protein